VNVVVGGGVGPPEKLEVVGGEPGSVVEESVGVSVVGASVSVVGVSVVGASVVVVEPALDDEEAEEELLEP
jgi:hypothetical protein